MKSHEFGKLIVLHGVNRSGKSTQSDLLVERIKHHGKKVAFIKYPIYDLKPTGPWINGYFREGNPYQFSPREMQLLNVINRRDSNIALMHYLMNGTHVVAESYASGGIVWGMASDIDRDILERLNTGRYVQRPDIEILLDRDPFPTGKEDGHAHEEKNELQRKVRNIYREYAEEHRWPIIDAARLDEKEEVHEEIWDIVRTLIL